MLAALLSLTALAGTTAYALRVPSPTASAAVLSTSVAWLLTNGPLEGPILWTVAPDRGLTTADLLVPVTVGAVALRQARRRRSRRRGPRGGSGPVLPYWGDQTR